MRVPLSSGGDSWRVTVPLHCSPRSFDGLMLCMCVFNGTFHSTLCHECPSSSSQCFYPVVLIPLTMKYWMAILQSKPPHSDWRLKPRDSALGAQQGCLLARALFVHAGASF